MAAHVQVALTEHVAIAVDGVPRVGPDSACELGPLARVAFAALVLQRHRPTPREELAAALWDDDPPATWRSALRGLLSRVRAALLATGLQPPPALTNTAGSYRLELPAAAVVDVEAAQQALATARGLLDARDDAGAARQQARRAVAATAGEFLPHATTAWVAHHRRRLCDLHVQALETLAQAALACGDHADALQAGQAAVDLEPLRESAHVAVMTAHLDAGNRGEAIRAYHRCRSALVEELGVCPSATTEAVYHRMLAEPAPASPPASSSPTPTPTPTNLPAALDSFVDSGEAPERVGQALSAARLLTLTGPPGIGKTRLAIESARQRLADYPDGVWLVDLAEVADCEVTDPAGTDAAGLAAQVCAVLGLRPEPEQPPLARLRTALADHHVLLVLDNCEHLRAATARLTTTLLRASCELTVLATSREPLRVAGEMLWSVPPLAVPSGQATALAQLWDFPSVRLFAERAGAVADDLALEHHPEAIACICRRLDGVPLAIELAAAHARALDLAEIAQRLDDHRDFLAAPPSATAERHRSLQAALESSHALLEPGEQRLFARLAVLPGDFGVEAAETVGAIENIAALEGLVSKSLLLARRQQGTTRYRMLEPVRQFAAGKLATCGEDTDVRARHLAWAQRLAQTAGDELKGPAQRAWLARLDAEHHNLLGALAWAASVPSRRPAALHLAIALWRFWELRGRLADGRQWLETLAGCREAPASLRAQGLNAAAVLAHQQSDHDAARRLYHESLAAHRRVGDRLGAAGCLNGLGHLAVSQGAFAHAQLLFGETTAIAAAVDHPALRAASLMNLAVAVRLVASQSSSHERAAQAARARSLQCEALAAYRALGDAHGAALCLENLGALAAAEGEDAQARAHLEESLAVRRDLGDRIGICGCGCLLGELARRRGDLSVARAYAEEALAIARELGSTQRETEALQLWQRLPAAYRAAAPPPRPPRRRARPVSLVHTGTAPNHGG